MAELTMKDGMKGVTDVVDRKDMKWEKRTRYNGRYEME